MSDTGKIVHEWFRVWEKGNFEEIPIAEDFKHTSPYGTIEGKLAYLELVKGNRDKFLGHTFEIHDEIYQGSKGCVRYTATKEDFVLEVTEWHYCENGLIREIVSYYNIDERRIEL